MTENRKHGLTVGPFRSGDTACNPASKLTSTMKHRFMRGIDSRITKLFERFNEPVIPIESIRRWLEQFDKEDSPNALPGILLPFFKRVEDFTIYASEHFTGITTDIISYDLDSEKRVKITGKKKK